MCVCVGGGGCHIEREGNRTRHTISTYTHARTLPQVITKISGFGKIGAMINAHGTKHVYTIDYPMKFFNLVSLNNRKNLAVYRKRKCGPEFADPLERVCNDFTGI